MNVKENNAEGKVLWRRLNIMELSVRTFFPSSVREAVLFSLILVMFISV